MLLLSRRIDEEIVIQTTDSEIVVAVMHVKGKQVGIGVKAPKRVQVLRRELLERAQIKTAHEEPVGEH